MKNKTKADVNNLVLCKDTSVLTIQDVEYIPMVELINKIFLENEDGAV